MKKLILIAVLTTVAAVVAPIASASAAEPVGSCEIKGEAKFTPEIELTPKAKVGYKFESSGGKCETVPATTFVKATVTGTGDIGCLASTEEAPVGKGTLKYKLGAEEVSKEFEFEFVAAGALVVFKTKGGVISAGFATFGAEGLEKCEKGKVASLPFTAFATGTV
jgi:hypothetical protein